jgi:putative aldouronate transport system permease protein
VKRTADVIVMKVISYIVLGTIALLTVLPFVILLVSSFTSEHYIISHGYTLIPKEFSLDAYSLIFRYPEVILRAYGVSIFITGVGTGVSLFLASMAAYVMYRKEVRYRNALAFFLFFTTLFNSGLAPYYMVITTVYHLKNTVFVMLLVPMFNVMYILILRNFIKSSIPDSLNESAKIDGAGDFRTFVQIILPLSKPALASIGLFTALAYWNDWWTPMMFVEKQALYPLQYELYRILSQAMGAAAVRGTPADIRIPQESLKLALTVVSTGPIVLAYPAVQKYFIKGITLGAVKG